MIIQNNRVLIEEKDLTVTNHQINIVKKSSGIKPLNVVILNDVSDNDAAINVLIEAYKINPV